MLKNKLYLYSLLFIICGCSVGPDYKKPTTVPQEQIVDFLKLTDKSSDNLKKLWKEAIYDNDLERITNLVLNNNFNLKIAKEKLQQARLNLYIARAKFGPTIDSQGSYADAKSFETPLYKTKSDYYQIGFDASWELDIWGGLRRLNESAQALLKATGENFENVKISLIAETASNYINYRLYEKLLNISEQNLESQKQILQIVKSKLDAGLTDKLSFEQAQSALETTKMQIPQLRSELNLYKNNLANLSGVLPDKLNLTTSNLLNRNIKLNNQDLTDLPLNIITFRPDIKIAEQQLISENALIGNKIANLLPNVSLSALLGWQNNTLSPIFGSNYQIYNLGGAVSMPILHWGSLFNQVELQKSVTNEAKFTYKNTVLTAIFDINQAIKNLQEENLRSQNAENNKNIQNRILDLSLNKYKSGLIDFSTVLQAQKDKLAAEQEYAQSLSKKLLYFISFNKSIGGYLSYF